MVRLTITTALVTAMLGSAALAETQAEIAARENEEGKSLMFSGKYAEASEKFQQAVARVPEAKYFFNLCTSRFQEGKFGEALVACNSADRNGDDKLKGKSAKMIEKIREEAGKQGVDLNQPAGGGASPGETPPVGDPNQPPVTDPNNPNQPPVGGPGPVGQPPQGYAVGRPPSVGLFTAQPVENKYAWSLGIDLLFGPGQIGQKNAFGNAGSGLRIKGDYMLNAASRIGAQGYFQYSHYGQGDDQMFTAAQTLDIIDLGIAGYKHLCGKQSRGCLTPLLGVHFAMMSPANETDYGTGEQLFNYGGFGARLELGYHYALGRRFEHVIGVMVGANLYTKAFSEPSDGYTAAEWGLDQGGRAAYLSFGYTYRFRTPFGSSPFVTLE